MSTRLANLTRYSTLIVVARAAFADDGNSRRFHDLDGPYIEGIARQFTKVIVVAPVFRRGRDVQYETLQGHSFRFCAPNIEVVALPEAGGSRHLSLLLAAFSQQVRILWRVKQRNPGALALLYFPTYRAAAMALLCRQGHMPYVVYSGGMWSEVIKLSPRWGQRPPWFLPAYVWVCKRLERIAYTGATVRLFWEAARLKEYELVGPTYRARPSMRIPVVADLPQRSPHEPARLLCVADRLPVKGHDILFHALAQLRREGMHVRLALAGVTDAGWQRELDQLATQLGIVGILDDLGWVGCAEQLRALYQAADVLVLPTRSEGFPRVFYEAMAIGLPVVTTNIPNIACVLNDKQHALLVPPNDPDALALAIRRVLTDAPLREQLRRTAWDWVREQFSQTDVEQFFQILRDDL